MAEETLCVFCRVEKGKTKSLPHIVFLTNSMCLHLYNDREKGDAMYIEVYVDSLFLVNFVMNLYLLLLVDKSAHCTATRGRLILGAAVGAVAYLIPFFLGGPMWLRLLLGLGIGTFMMIWITFRIKGIVGFFKILEKLLLYSFLMGGGILFLGNKLPIVREYTLGIFGVMGLGALVYILVTELQKRNHHNCMCKVVLSAKDAKMKVTALIDSGNSLVEPVSGKPVSVIEKKVFYGLWKEPPEFYRVIPYHSIGKKHGMLKGYLLPEIQIEVNGVTKICKEVYVAVSEESITGETVTLSDVQESFRVNMLVNPVLLKS